MKKSAILLVILVYALAFFIVGFYGMQVKSHFHVDYLSSIEVQESVLATDEPKMTMIKHTQTLVNEEQETTEERKRYQNYYEFETVVPYSEDLVLKFDILLKPTNTTYDDYKLWPSTAKSYVAEKQDDGKVFITNIKKMTGITAKAEFTVEDLTNNKTITQVKVYIR